MTVVELSSAETAAVLRWAPHLDADRKDVYGSRPDVTMRLTFESEDSATIAVAQLAIALQELQYAAANGPFEKIPPVLDRDVLVLIDVLGRCAGLSEARVKQAHDVAKLVVEQLAAEAGEKGTKH